MKKQPYRKSAFEHLDERRLLAGDLHVAPTDLTFELHGDDQSNSVLIQLLGPQRWLIRGLDGTTINGATGDVFLEGNLGLVQTHGGNDNVIYDYSQYLSVPQPNIFLETGNGDDTVQVIGSPRAIEIATGNGNDQIDLEGLQFTFFIFLSTGRGDDQVIVDASQLPLLFGNFLGSIQTSEGNDQVTFKGDLIASWFASLGDGDDVLVGEFDGSSPYSRVQADGGKGSDSVFGGEAFYSLGGFESFFDDDEDD